MARLDYGWAHTLYYYSHYHTSTTTITTTAAIITSIRIKTVGGTQKRT